MGFDYLDGKHWNQVTREERFFCQRLYHLVKEETPERFVAFLCDAHGLEVPVDGEWEVGFEVCFYRDLWKLRGRQGKLFSPKRTFDLCLFGEQAIIIIEAKAAEGFDSDQNTSFARDIEEVARQTGVPNVQLVGLCSSKYQVEPEAASTFTGPILRWKELAARYGGDEILLRADEIYEQSRPFAKSGLNSDAKLSGATLLDAFRDGANWWVGRRGGIEGAEFQEDLQTGRWRQQTYEVNQNTNRAPSPNYFSLAQFAERVRRARRTHPSMSGLIHDSHAGFELERRGEDLVLIVLCGGVGLYEVKFLLNDAERLEYQDRGIEYLRELADDARRNESQYRRRSI